MDNQQPSTSSSLSLQQEKMDKTEIKQVEKNMKEGSKYEAEDQFQLENNYVIDKLPPEMLIKILSYLDVQSLVNCRLISRKWNGIAREVLKQRRDLEISFECENKRNGELEISNRNRKVLSGFVQCFQASHQVPLYTRFQFNGFKTRVFDDPNWITFISVFGKSIKCLKLQSQQTAWTVDETIEFAQKLKHLLLNQLPNLQEFGLYLRLQSRSNQPPLSHIQLFATTTPSSNKQNPIQLPHLKILHLEEFIFSEYTAIVKDLLLVAVNLEKIEPFKMYESIDTFQLLHSFGKLDCVDKAQVDLDSDFMSKIQGQLSMPFKLKKLNLDVKEIFHNDTFWSDASVFISSIFESSKDTLRDLEMNSLGFLPNLQVPKFSKLIYLAIYGIEEEEIQVFPSKLNLNDVFPFLQYLELQVPWSAFSTYDEENQNNTCLPTIRTLVFSACGMTEEDVTRISKVCPKLKELKIYKLVCGGERGNFPQVAEAIWTHLKQIESLDLAITVEDLADGFPDLDSSFTGFSREDCSRLLDLVEAKEAAEKQETQVKSESNIQLDAERNKPSILDLKELRELKVRCFDYTLQDGQQWKYVIEECAFKLMENLTYEIIITIMKE